MTFLEKWGTGYVGSRASFADRLTDIFVYRAPNSTGAYELDLSLVGSRNWTDAWREMHLKTDVFCSGSIILPDKAGRQINVGGQCNLCPALNSILIDMMARLVWR